MAVVTLKAKAATNRDASPKVLSDSAYVKGAMKGFVGAVTAGSADSIGSKYIMGSIPSNAIVHSLMLNCGAITSAAGDIGLYKKTDDAGVAGVVVDADFFVAAKTLASAIVINAEQVNGNVITLANSEKKLWELLALTSDPNLVYDVVITLTAAATASAAVQLKCVYAE